MAIFAKTAKMIKFQNNDVILIQRSLSNNDEEFNDFPDSLLHFFTNVLHFLTRKQKNKNELLNIVLFLGDNDRVSVQFILKPVTLPVKEA